MTNYVLEHPIIDEFISWIQEVYCIKYTKKFKLYKEEDNYAFGIEIGNFERPIIVAGQFESDADFLRYLKEEFKFKQLYRTILFQAVKAQVDELDADLWFVDGVKDGAVITKTTDLVDNRHIRQIQNEHNI